MSIYKKTSTHYEQKTVNDGSGVLNRISNTRPQTLLLAAAHNDKRQCTSPMMIQKPNFHDISDVWLKTLAVVYARQNYSPQINYTTSKPKLLQVHSSHQQSARTAHCDRSRLVHVTVPTWPCKGWIFESLVKNLASNPVVFITMSCPLSATSCSEVILVSTNRTPEKLE